LDGPASIPGSTSAHTDTETLSVSQSVVNARASLLRLKRQGREASLLPSSSVEVKKDAAIPPLSPMSSWRSYLIRHRDNFSLNKIEQKNTAQSNTELSPNIRARSVSRWGKL
jgi:hypothetical protein